MNVLTTSKEHKGYLEEMVVLDETKKAYKYSLSNSLDDMRIAIYARTGCNINLNNAKWELNTRLSISVKHLMDTHGVNYSMTTDIKEKSRFIVVNMRVGDKWFITGYDEIKGKFYDWDLIQTYTKAVEIIEKYISSLEDEYE